MIVMKFGGSSVSDAARIKNVREIVRSRRSQRPLVVVSALRGVTDELLALARASVGGDLSLLPALSKRHLEVAKALGAPASTIAPLLGELAQLARGLSLLKELTPRTLDAAASFGERLSARLVAAAFSRGGLPAQALDAFDAGLVTDDRFGAASPLPRAYRLIRRRLRPGRKVRVLTGFIGKDEAGEITTLGRNGSDFSATIFGAALGASEVQIWSDTDGVMTADPRVAPGARPIGALSFAEASELAYYGGKVLHPHTLVPAIERRIPVRVLNTFKPQHPGTAIVARPTGERGVKSIAFRRHVPILSVSSPRMASGPGFLARIFDALAAERVSVNMVTTSEVTVSLTADDPQRLARAAKSLSQEFSVTLEADKAIVCVVGEGIRDTPGVAAEVFCALKDAGVNVLMISQGASKINLAVVVESSAVPAAVGALHRRFFGA